MSKVPPTLLLADDSVTIQRVIELTFADEDVRVVAVGDGSQAIAMIDQSPPDIVLADVGMPGLNGYEVARHIKDTPRLSHIPVVLLTGAFEPIDQARVAEVGCDGVLAKPFEPQLVIARVKELLATPRAARVEPTPAIPPSPVPPSNPEIDNYFDRLDAALSSHVNSPQYAASSPDQLPAATDSWQAPPAEPEDIATLKEFATTEEFTAPDEFESVTIASPRAQADAPSSNGAALSHAVQRAADEAAASSPANGGAAVVFPALADAFAALLAAEQAGPAATTAPVWPAATASRQNSAAVPDDIVEQVTRRVLAEMSDRVVRETVGELVLATAERLVREELDRIKKQIDESVKE